MMAYKRVLTVQDLSCAGQCSLAVALPILSACALEACPLPTALLSAHSAFQGFTFCDLTDEMPRIIAHWKREGILFDGLLTGYLGSARQVQIVREALRTLGAPGAVKIVDPAMADHGKLYTGFDESFVQAVRALCLEADVLLPNMTEACLLTGTPWREGADEAFARALLKKLEAMGVRACVLTGVPFDSGNTGVLMCEEGSVSGYEHPRVPGSCHGTGDIFAAAFAGARLRGLDTPAAARVAADYTLLCIRETVKAPAHAYGVKFEPVLGKLIAMLDEAVQS